MRYTTYIPMLHLQLFADGGAGGVGTAGDGTALGSGVTASAAGVQTGDKGQTAPEVKYGIQPKDAPAAEVQKQTTAPIDRNAEFDKLIKGEYKEQYQTRMQDTVRKRLQANQDTVDRYNALVPSLELLAQKYGIADVSDTKALAKAIEQDNAYWEDEALRRGMPVDEVKRIYRMQRENESLRQQVQDTQRREAADQQQALWLRQEAEAKQFYPSLDLNAELSNPQFESLLKANVDVKTAYEVIHNEELISAAMRVAARKAEEKLAKSVAANGARPVENGMGAQAPAVVKSDVSKLTKADMAEIERRVRSGERISFG